MNKIPDTVNSEYLNGHGDLDHLEYREDIPVPVPGPYQVLVEVSAAGVANTDINTRTAWYSKGVSEKSGYQLVGEFHRISTHSGRGYLR